MTSIKRSITFDASSKEVVIQHKSHLRRSEAQACVEELRATRQCERLTIVGCKLKQAPDETCELKSLNYLNLSENVLETLPDKIGQLSLLERLVVRENRLELLPDSLLSLSALRLLDLSKNRLKKLPQPAERFDERCRRAWTRLETLLLASNLLDRCPPHVAFCAALKCVSLEHNNIAEWPQELSQCALLEGFSFLCNIS